MFWTSTDVMLLFRTFHHAYTSRSIYPDIWRLANVTPIIKKGDKQLIKNYIVGSDIGVP